jgi:hypothetical protein
MNTKNSPQILLLTIQPGPDRSEVIVRSKVVQYRISHQPNEGIRIFLNDHLFLVPPNLEAALRRLRFDTASRVLWPQTQRYPKLSARLKEWHTSRMKL